MTSLRRRLERLESRLPPTNPRLTPDEMVRRGMALIHYSGNDPAILARRDRVVELFRIAQERQRKAEAKRQARQQKAEAKRMQDHGQEIAGTPAAARVPR
jgi:hypothetical protein